MFLLPKAANVMVVKMNKKLKRILFNNKGRNIVNKTKLEKLLFNVPPDFGSLINKNKEIFEDKYKKLKSQYASSEELSRFLFFDNVRIMNLHLEQQQKVDITNKEKENWSKEVNKLKLSINKNDGELKAKNVEINQYKNKEKDMELLKKQNDKLEQEKKDLVERIKQYEKENQTKEKQYKLVVDNFDIQLDKSKKKEKH